MHSTTLETCTEMKFQRLIGPPPDSLYNDSTITVWFNHSVINQDYLCDYWDYYYNPPKNEQGGDEIHSGMPVGCFAADSNLITDASLLQTLNSLGVTRMCQYSMLSPCEDTLSFTRYGDTIRTPEFWNSFYIELDSGNAVEAVATLIINYGGDEVDFAELNQYKYFDVCDEPSDPNWDLQINYDDLFYSENVVCAWDYQHGSRDIKVAVVDDGIRYSHSDLGGDIGANYRVVDGREYRYPNNPLRPPSDGGAHGTPCAGFIGAIVDNEFYVAGIGGGWNSVNDGVSIYAMKCSTNYDYYGRPVLLKRDVVNAWTEAVANTSGNRGFAVDIVSRSGGDDNYDEEIRRVLDYSYRMGVSCFASKGNANSDLYHCPADLEYHKIVSVGSYGIKHEEGNDYKRWIPTRARGIDVGGASNYGYGLDIMGHGDNRNQNVLMNQTLSDDGTRQWMSHTSAATPQVAGVAALILSEYEDIPHPNIDGLAPEDVQGLLCISAQDMKYYYSDSEYDTSGYDAETGYGLLKAKTALEYMMSPYELRHFSATGGTSVGTKTFDDFFIQAPTVDVPSLIDPGHYKAVRHTVQKNIEIEDWLIARSWGRGGDGTKGWSSVQPTDADNNASTCQTGYCRVVGNPDAQDNDAANFNYNNIRDICYSNDALILETYCFQVYDIDTDEFLGWLPCEPDEVVYRYTIWGRIDPSSVQYHSPKIDNTIELRCESKNILGSQRAYVHYKMKHPGPVTLRIYDQLGNLVLEKDRNLWSQAEEMTISADLSKYSSGVYFVILKSKDAAGFGKLLIY